MDALINPFEVPELRFVIALKTPIPDLASLCQQNSIYAMICRDEQFWKTRYELDYPGLPLYYGRTYKESYRLRYEQCPFGYYVDDEAKLLSIQPVTKYRVLDVIEPVIGQGLFTSSKVMMYMAHHPRHRNNYNNSHTLHNSHHNQHNPYNQHNPHSTKMSLTSNQKTFLFDMLTIQNIDQPTFIKECFMMMNINRTVITLPESIDLLFIIAGSSSSVFNSYLGDREKASILSSLNCEQLHDFLGPNYVNYDGFPDYPNILNAAISNHIFAHVCVNDKGNVVECKRTDFASPSTLERYRYVKQFELVKILFLWRCYRDILPDLPFYFYVTLQPGNAYLEQWMQHISRENYMETLNTLSIRTDDHPSYRQAVARLTILHSLNWICCYERDFVFQALNLPTNLVSRHIRWEINRIPDYVISIITNYLRVM